MNTIQQQQTEPVTATAIDLLDPQKYAPATRPKSAVRRVAERGFATAEYAVGLLCILALALIVYRFVSGKDFVLKVLKYVTELIGKFGGMI